jgi:hypothetical protein
LGTKSDELGVALTVLETAKNKLKGATKEEDRVQAQLEVDRAQSNVRKLEVERLNLERDVSNNKAKIIELRQEAAKLAKEVELSEDTVTTLGVRKVVKEVETAETALQGAKVKLEEANKTLSEQPRLELEKVQAKTELAKLGGNDPQKSFKL